MEDAFPIEKLSQFCRQFVADPAQARLMAIKLKERSEQLSRERGVSQLEAMRYLLSLFTGEASKKDIESSQNH